MIHHQSFISLLSVLLLLFLERCKGSFQVHTPLSSYGQLRRTPLHASIASSDLRRLNINHAARRHDTATSHISSATRTLRSSTRCNLRMHFGHSHDHSHGHNHSHNHNHEIQRPPPPPKPPLTAKTLPGKLFQLITVRHRRLSSSVLFSAIATLLPPLLLKKRGITRTDAVIFCFLSSTLSGAEKFRQQFRIMRKRALRLRDDFVKNTFVLQNTAHLDFRISNTAADRITYIGVVINLLLSVGKASVGMACHSSALIADAAHSLSDLFSDFITLWAVQVARLPPDEDHPYGHGKFEAVGSLFLSLMLLGTGIHVGTSSNAKLFKILSGGMNNVQVMVPTAGALVMAGLSIVSKEWLYRITRKVGEKLNSQVLIANAWHHRSDAYSSVLALASIGVAMCVPGLLWVDSAAGLLVAGMICMTGAEIMGESMKQLTDTGDLELIARIRKHLRSEVELSEDIEEITRVRGRWMGSRAVVDIALTTKDSLSSSAIRAVEERLKFRIMKKEERVIDAEVHATTTGSVGMEVSGTETKLEGRSPHQVEDVTREILLGHDQVQSVEGCTVHYKDVLLPTIHANIKLKNPESITVAGATSLATELRELLETSDSIYKANIFLDLSEDEPNENDLNDAVGDDIVDIKDKLEDAVI